MKTAVSLALLCAALASCAPIERRGVPDVPDVRAQAAHAYRAGRTHHLARRPEAARTAYLAALQLLPTHLDARNGLAALHAEYGEFSEAIAIWRELTQMPASGADRAYLFGNLGQAYILLGEHQAAVTVLEQACRLDPLSERSWQLLGETLRVLGQEERAARMLAQAASLRGHDLRADIAATGAAGIVAAPEQSDWSQAYLHVRVDGMMELRRTPAPQAAAMMTTPMPALTSTAPAVARLEIRNGNGISGMARTVARQIDEPALRVTLLSNEPGFAVRQTRIDYAAGHQDAARRLARRLGSAELRQVDDCAPADLRLVLGHDLARGAMLRPAVAQLRKTG